jgi:hypothetical protein
VPLTRKRRKELTQLKKDAGTLVREQREVLEEASKIVREASRQASNYAKEEVGPRIRDGYESKIAPTVDRAASTARGAVHSAGSKIQDDVLPAVGAAIGSAIAALDVSNKPEVQKALKKARKKAASTKKDLLASDAGKKATELAVKSGLVKAPKSSGPGKYILIGLGVVVVAAVAYAAYQTLRADDDLWIDDEDFEPVDQADVETPEEE